MQVPIAHAEEVEQVFDAISYCKGACVVKMLNAVLGPDMFKKGLQVWWCLMGLVFFCLFEILRMCPM